MKKETNSYWIAILTTIVVVFVFVSSSLNKSGTGNHHTNDPRYPKVFDIDEKDIEWIENLLDTMSLRDKCAQMIMAPVYRNYMYDYSKYYKNTISYIRDENIGGLIMFQGELQKQVEFIAEAQKLSDIPLLIASDFEQGLGTRIDDVLEFPHAMALGASVQD